MHVITVGINHSSAPLELRERVAYTDETRSAALAALKTFCAEAVILDTCNRSEIYALCDDDSALALRLSAFVCDFHQLPRDMLQAHLYTYVDQEAVAHLCTVASGLDSLVIGEAQILAQVRAAFEFAVSHNACGPLGSALFRQALRVGKRARTDTHIGQGSLSLSAIAIERAQEVMGSLAGCAVLLIGAGKMSTLAARKLQSLGVRQITVANRTLVRSQKLADEIGGVALPLAQVPATLANYAVVFTATSAPHQILSREMVAHAVAARKRPLCIVDLALPRDVDPSVTSLTGVQLIDLDGLKSIAERNLAQRGAEMSKIQPMIAAEVDEFWNWLRSLSVTPIIAALHARAEQIRQSELADHLGRLKNLSPQEKRVIETMTASIIGRLLREPTLRLKARAHEGDGLLYAATLRDLFDLDDHHAI
jgi:glutamyl-tRNA reductase